MEKDNQTEEILLLTCSPHLTGYNLEQLAGLLKMMVATIDGKICMASARSGLMKQNTNCTVEGPRSRRMRNTNNATPTKVDDRGQGLDAQKESNNWVNNDESKTR